MTGSGESIGFLGAGRMAQALAEGWRAAGLLDVAASIASAPSQATRDRFAQAVGCRVTADNLEVVRNCRLLILGVKPHMMAGLLDQIAPRLTADHLVVTVAAGKPIRFYQDKLGETVRLVRAMPNTPCLVGASATGLTPASGASAVDRVRCEKLFSAVGRSITIPESQLDALTGLSGSGPAYIFMAIEALADGGVRAGLPRAAAQMLAAQTVFGAAKMVLETGKHPGELKDAVASPGGTTIAGVHALERGGLRAAFMDAVLASATRSAELGKEPS